MAIKASPYSDPELFTPRTQRTFRGRELLQIALPIGGIGAGCVSLNGQGGLQDFAVLADEGHAIVVMVGNFVDATHKEASFFQQWALVIAPKDGPQQPIAVSVGVGDFNHDGHQDLITLRGSPAWQIEVWLGSGTGSFSRVGGRFVPPDSTGVQVADIDGDGCDDLVVTSALTTTVLHNEGSISGSCPGGSLWSHFLLPKE